MIMKFIGFLIFILIMLSGFWCIIFLSFFSIYWIITIGFYMIKNCKYEKKRNKIVYNKKNIS